MTRLIKCVVWDLDNTLWEGTLLEGDELHLRPNVSEILEELSSRGILNSIASRNDKQAALAVLRQFNLEHHFIAPQINSNPKAENIRLIAKNLNLGIDSLAFIDDSPFERESVIFSCPSVMVIDAKRYNEILDLSTFNPPVQTEESRRRVESYQDESERLRAERKVGGTFFEFLRNSQICLILRAAKATDVPRIVELADRTNQFNSSGICYSSEEVEGLIKASNVHVVVAELRDRFGNYGNIGVMVLRLVHNIYMLDSIMVSCRVDGRGIPSAMLILSMRIAQRAGIHSLQAKYRSSRRNRQIGILYHMLGFHLSTNKPDKDMTFWIYDLSQQSIPEMPVWLTLNITTELLTS